MCHYSSERSSRCLRVCVCAVNLLWGSNWESTLSHLFHRVCPSVMFAFHPPVTIMIWSHSLVHFGGNVFHNLFQLRRYSDCATMWQQFGDGSFLLGFEVIWKFAPVSRRFPAQSLIAHKENLQPTWDYSSDLHLKTSPRSAGPWRKSFAVEDLDRPAQRPDLIPWGCSDCQASPCEPTSMLDLTNALAGWMGANPFSQALTPGGKSSQKSGAAD